MNTFDKSFWEEHYQSRSTTENLKPSPQLALEAEGLSVGKALDAGCGEGTDAIWLASNGWQVTAVDISDTALQRAEERAKQYTADISGKIEWRQEDLTNWTPSEGQYDLVTSQYAHTAESSAVFYRKLAAAVAPGGTLLIVGHQPPKPHETSLHAHGSHFTAEEIAAILDPKEWDIIVAEPRTYKRNDVTLSDAVLRAQKR